MLTSVTLTNFKGARSLSVRLAPLTLLSGLNSAGKSTVLQSLCLIRQSSLGEGLLTQTVELQGPLVQFGSFSDVISHGATSDNVSVSVCSNGVEWGCTFTAQQHESSAVAVSQRGGGQHPLSGDNFQLLLADRVSPATRFPRPMGRRSLAGPLGARGEFTADVLAHNSVCAQRVPLKRQAQSNPLLVEELTAKVAPTDGLLDQVSAWLQLFSPGVRVKAEGIAGTDDVRLAYEYVGRVGLQETSDPIRPTNVGFGLTYALPVIAAALLAPEESLLLLENPEAHLHPRGQFHLGILLAQAVSDGVQVVVETHSDHVLNGVRLAVKNKVISNEEVAFHFFSREMKTGDVGLESPALLPDGSIPTWPEGFFDEWDNALIRLLKS